MHSEENPEFFILYPMAGIILNITTVCSTIKEAHLQREERCTQFVIIKSAVYVEAFDNDHKLGDLI